MTLPLPATSSFQPLRILSFGAGAIGTYIGGSLALAGHQVVFLEKPNIAKQLKNTGLILEISGKIRQLSQPSVEDNLDSILACGPFDVGLFALKSFDTRSALEGMVAQTDRLPPILSLQNGVENEGIIAEFLGKEKVIAGTVTSAIGRRGPGHIVLERLRGSGISSGHPLSSRLVQAMYAAGLNTHLFTNADQMKWSKMLTNLLANATSAILDMPPTQIFSNPSLFKLEILQLRETLQVMRALKIPVVDLPGTPVILLAFSVRWLPLQISRPLLTRAVGGGRGQKMPSFHIDLHSGRGKSEVNYLNGAVVKHGRRLNIPTPVNQLLNDTLTGLTEGKLSLQDFANKPEALLNRLNQI